MVAHQNVELAEIGGHLPEPALVTQRLRETLGPEEVVEEPRELAERNERTAQMEAEIDGLLGPHGALGEMPQRGERLLEERRRFSVGRAVDRLGTGLPQILDRLLPAFALKSMVAQPFEMLGYHAFQGERWEQAVQYLK